MSEMIACRSCGSERDYWKACGTCASRQRSRPESEPTQRPVQEEDTGRTAGHWGWRIPQKIFGIFLIVVGVTLWSLASFTVWLLPTIGFGLYLLLTRRTILAL